MSAKSAGKALPSAKKKPVVSQRGASLGTLEPYISFVNKHNLLEGPAGKQRLAKEVLPLIDAFHKVLAGGTVSQIRVKGPYEKLVVEKCSRIMQASLAQANEINERAGGKVAFG